VPFGGDFKPLLATRQQCENQEKTSFYSSPPHDFQASLVMRFPAFSDTHRLNIKERKNERKKEKEIDAERNRCYIEGPSGAWLP